MITINLSYEQAAELKDIMQHSLINKNYSCTEVLSEAITQIQNQQIADDDELPWDTDTAWSRYEQICTALSGCQLASQYK
ncbi:hypothetical protein OPT79_71 [Klebsiella phage vB_KpnD_Opt-79]|uniref:Uncharacterized protein n=1 Tax=Escherichia phage vB_EcoD_Sadiya TaxID=2902684 RepID=A0AC61TRL0_9CAUD|nr:hypothetical protein OPT719_69 [Escherichia phage vB_EcoD_Opt-719]UGO52834.1 hypothetical protein OPT79_71 [Klebsiella phage vB_KpnD_Opt-79]UGV22600.1 hypothetical protein PHLEASOLO_72 [Escherichia phage vB_ EcoD_Phleasolo]UGV22760.1 hypothetical protein SADIYA_71 [Escherichia phage vB_EcoD_Sadiya]